MVVPVCFHTYCTDCLSQFFQIHIKDGSINQIKCPDPSCSQQVLPQCVMALVTPEEYDRYETLQIQKSLEAMADVYWCPRCQAATLKA